MIDRETEAMADEILDQTKATFRTVNVQSGLGKRQAGVLIRSFRQVGAFLFQPFPILRAPDPLATTLRAPKKSEAVLQLRRLQLRRFADGTLHDHMFAFLS
jgi:hypothetical protein